MDATETQTAPCGHPVYAVDHCAESSCDNYYMKCILWGTPLEDHLQGHDQPETQFLVCRSCGEAFDSITPAHEHGTADLSGSAGWCGDDGFDILPESEAF